MSSRRWRGGRVDFHTGPDLDLVEHGPARRAFVGELLLALHVLDDELAVRIIFIDGVELCAERWCVALARDAGTLVR